MNGAHEFGGESTARVMSPFWPRIGEQQVKRRNAAGGQQVRYCVI